MKNVNYLFFVGALAVILNQYESNRINKLFQTSFNFLNKQFDYL